MRPIKNIIIHCADTPTGKHFTTEDIDAWHVARGFKRQDTYREAFNPELKAIGYHFVIYINGEIHTGRQVAEVGAHASGLNSESIGICMIGSGKYTPAQWLALKDLVERLQLTFQGVKVLGHYQVPSGIAQGKTCPEFNVPFWVNNAMVADPLHVA